MNEIEARKGQKVKRGDLIGYVGSSGSSTAHIFTMKSSKMEEKSIRLIISSMI